MKGFPPPTWFRLDLMDEISLCLCTPIYSRAPDFKLLYLRKVSYSIFVLTWVLHAQYWEKENPDQKHNQPWSLYCIAMWVQYGFYGESCAATEWCIVHNSTYPQNYLFYHHEPIVDYIINIVTKFWHSEYGILMLFWHPAIGCVGRSHGCWMEGVSLGYLTRTCSLMGSLPISLHEIFFPSFKGILFDKSNEQKHCTPFACKVS